MATVFQEDFSGAADNTPATASTTAFSVVSGAGTKIHDNEHTKVNPMALKMETLNQSTNLAWTFAETTTTRWLRFYIWPVALPATNQSIVTFRLALAGRANLRIDAATGAVTLRNESNDALATTASPLTLGAWNRIEVEVTPGGTCVLRLFPGATGEDVVTPAAGNQVSGDVGIATSMDTIAIGHLASGTFSAWYAQIKVDDVTWVGPAVSFAASGGSEAVVNVVTTGGGRASRRSGSTPTVEVTDAGGGRKNIASGSVAVVNVVATGGGTAAESGQGGSEATVDVVATGAGTTARSGGSVVTVNVVATGGGVLTGDGFAELVISVVSPIETVPFFFWLDGQAVPVDLFFVGASEPPPPPPDPNALVTRAGDAVVTRAGDPILVRT